MSVEQTHMMCVQQILPYFSRQLNTVILSAHSRNVHIGVLISEAINMPAPFSEHSPSRYLTLRLPGNNTSSRTRPLP